MIAMAATLDMRYAWRLVMRHRVITICAVVSIGLCAAAAALGLGIVAGAEHAHLPYAAPDGLVHVVSQSAPGRSSGHPDFANRTVPLDLASNLTRGVHTLPQAALMAMPVGGSLPGSPGPQRVVLRGVSPTLFTILGRGPALGRTFGPGDGGLDQPRVAVLTHAGWRTVFGGDSAVVGRRILCRSVIYTIIGVMPQGIEGDERLDGWIPIAQSLEDAATHSRREADAPVWVVARMAPGSALQDVQRELDLRMRELRPTLPGAERAYGITAVSMRAFMYPGFLAQVRWYLEAAVLILVLITVLSLSLLMLARDIGRTRDLALRASLGASAWQLVRPYALEAVIVGGMAAGFGTVLVEFLYAQIRGSQLLGGRWWVANGLSIGAISIGVGLALGMSLLSLTLAARRAADAHVTGRSPYRSEGFSARARHASARIVGAEVALAVIMLSLLGASAFRALQLARLNLGFDPGRLVRVIAPDRFLGVRSGSAWRGAMNVLEAELRGVPEVIEVGAFQPRQDTSAAPHEPSSGAPTDISSPDHDPILIAYANPQFFGALQIRPVRGRAIASEEDAVGAPVAILSRKAAAMLFAARDPLGSTVRLTINGQRLALTVVGVVEDVNITPLRDLASPPTVYSPALLDSASPPLVITRGSVPAAHLASTIDAALKPRYGGDAPSIFPFANAFVAWRELQEVPLRAIAPVVIIAFVAALLGMIAIVSDAIGRRMQELGIRAALGASPLRNAGVIVRSVSAPLGVGVALGVVLTIFIARPFAQLTGLGDIPGWVPVAWALSFLPAAALAVMKPIVRSVTVAPAQLLREL